MSAYPYAGTGPPYSPPSTADPTAVIGRRIGAWVIDAVLFWLLMAFFGPSPLSPFAEYYDEADLAEDNCDFVMEVDDDATNCLDIGDRFYVTDTTESLIQGVVALAWVLLVLGALQGVKGVTPGKALFQVKVVDEQGGPPGFGRALGRTVLWVVDGAPWCLPLVGFVTGLSSKGHRRVGDMAAKTFVVDRSHTGPVIVPGLTTAAAAYGPGQPWGGAPGGAPPPGAAGGAPGAWGVPPPGAAGGPYGAGTWAPPPQPPPAGWGPPPTGPASATPSGAPPGGPPEPGPAGERPPFPTGWAPPGGARPAPPAGSPAEPSAVPADRPGEAGAAGPPAAMAPGESPEEAEPPERAFGEAPPAAAPGPPGDAAAGPQGEAEAAPAGYEPQWDAARGTYIVWEPDRGAWLGWDEAAKTWKPL
ncbi:MAG TPA: RDD family protein [Acidimicrobiales bacterium]|nr:RDD family protein [Acidimicrobiales bacterium]